MTNIVADPRPTDLLDLPDDVSPIERAGWDERCEAQDSEMTDEEFRAYDAWVSEQEAAAGLDETEQAEFDAVWTSL